MQDIFRHSFQSGKFHLSEDAKKHGKLHMFAMIHEHIEELGTSFVSLFVRGDIVGAEEGSAIIGQRTVGHGR